MSETKLVCALFNAGKKDELTSQCQERILAGLTFQNATLCFVGAKTWLMKTMCPDKFFIELNNCNDTIGNIREISQFVRNKNFTEILIISNHYHLRRIKLLLRIFGVKATVVSAEEVLGLKNRVNVMEYFLYIGTYTAWKLGVLF